MRARRGDCHGAFRGLLTVHFGKVDVVLRETLKFVAQKARRRFDRQFAAQKSDRLPDRRNRYRVDSVDKRGLFGVLVGYDDPAQPHRLRAARKRQNAAARARRPVKGQLADNRVVVKIKLRAAGSDKGDAMRDVVNETRARQTIFIGDDLAETWRLFSLGYGICRHECSGYM